MTYILPHVRKTITWVGSALEDLRGFSDSARRDAGHALDLVQLGQEPPDWRAMPTIGMGAAEIRVHAETEYRVVYVAKFTEGIYVLHAFAKRAPQTRQADIALARARLHDVVQWRRQQFEARKKEGR